MNNGLLKFGTKIKNQGEFYVVSLTDKPVIMFFLLQ